LVNEPTQKEIQGINTVLKNIDSKQKRNQTLFAAIIVVVIIAIAAFFLFSTPTEPLPPPVDLCLNGVQDAGEEGIDCGGTCSAICSEPPLPYIDPAYVLPTSISDIAPDTAGDRIYVIDEMRHRLMAYDSEFNHISNFGEDMGELPNGGFGYISGGTGDNQLLFPASIYVANNKIYVLDRAKRIQVLSKDLEYEKTLRFSDQAIENLPKLEDTPNADGGTSSIAVATNGNIYVSDEVSNAIALFDSELNLLNAIEPEEGSVSLNMPRQIAIGPTGNVFVADSANGRIQVFDSELNFLKSITGNLLIPVGIAVSSAGKMFVLDNGDSKLKVLASDGVLIEEIGGLGTAQNQFYNLATVKLDSQENIYVVEEGNSRVQVFDQGLNFVKSIKGLDRTFNVSFAPFYPAISPNGDIALSDPINCKVFILDSDFELKKVLGGKGFGNNELNTPKGLAFDYDGRLYVSDSGNRRVQVFSNDYKYLKTITNNKLIWPLGISVSEDGKVYVVDDKYKNILIFNSDNDLIGEIGAEQGITLPLGILAKNGKIYITDDLEKTIEIFDLNLRKIESIGGIDPKVGAHVEFNESLGINNERLLFCDNRNRTVVALGLSANEFSTFGDFGSSSQELSLLEIASNEEVVVVTDMEYHRVKFFNSSNSEIKEITIESLT